MKKLIDALKRNKNALIVIVLLLALVLIVIILNTNKSLSVTTSGGTATAKTETELKLERILAGIEGVGEAEVMINQSESGISGVVIVCQGANNIMTRNDVLNAVCTALNIDGNNVAIYAMNNQ